MKSQPATLQDCPAHLGADAAVLRAQTPGESEAKTVKTVTIEALDGFELGARVYESEGVPRAQVVIHAATATPQRYYQAFAEHLVARGFRVLTYDYRGIGASRRGSLRGFAASMTTWAEQDARAVLRHAHASAPELPLFVVGHSFGGQIALALPDETPIAATLMVGAQSGYWKGFDWPNRGAMWMLWNVMMPAVSSTWGYVPGWMGIGEDLPAGVARQWARWCTTPGYFLGEHPEYGKRMQSHTGPVMVLSFSDDDYVPLQNAQWLIDQLAHAQVEHRHLTPEEVGLPEIGHFGFFRRANATLWSFADRTFDAVLQDAWQPRPTVWLHDSDLMADLQYGRP
jgi:predicted alpha/beta hydrolase